MNCNDHGGDCCGMSHIHGMGSPIDEKQLLDDTIRDIMDEQVDGCDCADCRAEREGSHLIEVVVNDRQVGGWRKVLEDRGFKEVSSFTNSNTQSRCYIFHLIEEVGG